MATPTGLFSSAYLAPVQYYAHLLHSDEARIERCDSYQKQTYRNRCLIAGPQGPQALTIPIVKPEPGHQQMKDIRISDHGNWRHLHWTALRSAYSSSPFFEYYADDFAPFYEQRIDFLFDFNLRLQQLVCSLLDIDTPMTPTEAYMPSGSAVGDTAADSPAICDYRELIQPRTPLSADASFVARPYYQVFAQRLGFLPNLSIADLLFNMGPEGLLLLQQSIKPGI